VRAAAGETAAYVPFNARPYGGHERLLALAGSPARALDVGCSTGYLARRLAERGAAVVGIEVDGGAAAAAREVCEQVLVGDVETMDLPFTEGSFDVVLCGDVLEHLRDPWGALASLATLLRPGATAVVSVPNVAHWTGRRALVRGSFPYAPHGLFDRTHLRFFTRAGARELVAGAGLSLRAERFAPAPLPLQAHVPALRRLEPAAARAWPELFALQVVLVGERPAVSGPSTPDRASR
jgi:SAM-dependent methyltransferase